MKAAPAMNALADRFALLAEPRRLAIVRLVWERERAAGEIHAALPDVTFGAVSQHLRKLADAGVVACRKDGRRRLYRAQRESLGEIALALDRMWATQLDRLRELAEADARATPTTRPRRAPRRQPARSRRG